MASDTDIDACCYTNPGAKTDHIEGRIGQLTRPSDEVIVLQIGSNNMPDDTALTLIDKLDELIDDDTSWATGTSHCGSHTPSNRQSQLPQ